MPNRGFYCHSCRNSFQLPPQPSTPEDIPQCPECQSDFVESYSYEEDTTTEIPPIIRQLFFGGSNSRNTFTQTQREATDVNDTYLPFPPFLFGQSTTAAAGGGGDTTTATTREIFPDDNFPFPFNSTGDMNGGFIQNIFQQLADGRFGDFVTNQHAFDDIITQTLNAGGNSDQRKKGLSEDEIQLLMHLIVKLEECNTTKQEEEGSKHTIKDGMITLPTSTSTSTSTEECTICQEEYKQGDIVILLNRKITTTHSNEEEFGCVHFFHENCALNWLKMSNSCPVCRKYVIKRS